MHYNCHNNQPMLPAFGAIIGGDPVPIQVLPVSLLSEN